MGRRREKTRPTFLSASSRLVARGGFDAIGVTDIAAEADYAIWYLPHTWSLSGMSPLLARG